MGFSITVVNLSLQRCLNHRFREQARSHIGFVL
jgi:hypothetical protein